MRWNCLLILFVLCGCDEVSVWPRPTPHTIPFETIAIDEGGISDEGTLNTEPYLFLLTTTEQLTTLNTMVTPQSQAALHQVELESYVVIGLFLGRQPTGGYVATINQITQRDNRIIVHAELEIPNIAPDAITAPYHLVKVARTQLPIEQLELVLEPTFVTPTPIVR